VTLLRSGFRDVGLRRRKVAQGLARGTGGSALGAALLNHTPATSLPLWSGTALAAGTILIITTPAVFGRPSRTDRAPSQGSTQASTNRC
jgi:hypothetical protein